MLLLPNQLASRQPQGMALRQEAMRINWTFNDLPAADGHALRCRFACGVRAIDDSTEIQMLQDVLIGSRACLTTDDVARHFGPSLRNAAVGVADDKGVEAWLSGNDKELFIDTLRAAAEKLAFACGIEILPPFQLDLESPSFEQKRLRDLQRSLAEQEAAGRVEHFNRATEQLKRFEEIRANAPELTPGAILSRLSPVDQGATLQTLMLASAKQETPGDLWAVGGDYLVRIHLHAENAPGTELFAMPPKLGPLRSIQPGMVDGERVLLVGARSGFYLVRRDDPQNPECYPDLGMQSQLGFSRVVFQNRERGFAACHGEAGLVRWNYKHSTSPSEVFRPERFGGSQQGMPPAAPALPVANGSIQMTARIAGPRNLQVLDDRRLLLSLGSRLWILDGEEASELPATGSAEIIAIVADARSLHVIHEEGTIATLESGTLRVVATRHRPMKVRSAAGMPWLGSMRLLLAGDEGPVQCIGVDDSMTTEYASAHRGIRALCASSAAVVGISADRQRLLVWNAWDGRSPAAEIYLTTQTRHRIADVDFA